MPRFVKRTRATKRQTKWCGATGDFDVPNTTNIAVSSPVALCSNTTAVNDQADPVVGWCKGQISVSRIIPTDEHPSILWAVVLGRLDPDTGILVQTFNPFDASHIERQDILGMGAIEATPVVLIPSTDVPITNGASAVANINIKVGRKLPRNTNNLFLWVVSDSLNLSFRAQVTVRTLMKF